MSVFRYFLTIPISPNEYGEEIEITERVVEGGSSNISQKLSNNEYDVGSIKFNKISVQLINSDSFFSEASSQFSYFTYKRDASILRIQWDVNPYSLACGSAPCGYTYLSAPVNIYEGLLEDNSTKFNEDSQIITFTFLGLESIIGKVQTNFSDLLVTDNAETLLFKILNQTPITNILNLNQSNISVNENFIPDDISDLEDTTCLESIDKILFLAGAALYVQNREIIVKPRQAGAVVKYTFYGKSSNNGIENIVSLDGITTGLNRTFNFWKWEDNSVSQQFVDSIEQYGFRKKEVDSTLVTNNAKRLSILSGLINEYGFPRQELELTAPMYTPIVKDIFLLDKVKLDIPIDYVLPEDGSLPSRYGRAIYGESRYAGNISAFSVDAGDNWYILNRSINIKSRTITYRLRKE